MARKHGNKGRFYMGIASDTAAAQPVAFINKWTLDFLTDKAEVTAMGDTNKIYVAGLPDSKGTISGWWDDATPQLYTAAQDGLPRRMYLYPSNDDNGKYWFGTILPDQSLSGGVSEAIGISGSFAAASPLIRVG